MTLGVLMLHAFPLDAAMWDGQLSSLSSDIPVVAPNLPGFGDAPLVEPEHWMDDAADSVDQAVTGAGIDRVIVCGLSMGGYVALAYLRRCREKVAGIVLANTRADADDEAAQQRRRDLAARLRSDGNFLADSPPPLLADGAPAATRERVRAIIAGQPAEAIARASLGMAHRVDSRPDLPGIGVPTLVITSDKDALIAPTLSEEMAASIPGARLETIEGVGHLSNLEAPAEFNRLLGDFVQDVRSRESAN